MEIRNKWHETHIQMIIPTIMNCHPVDAVASPYSILFLVGLGGDAWNNAYLDRSFFVSRSLELATILVSTVGSLLVVMTHLL